MKLRPHKTKRDKIRRGDRRHVASKDVLAHLPKKVDLRRTVAPRAWPVWNQDPYVSCTAHAAAGVALFAMIHAKRKPLFQPSRLFLYHCERALMTDDHQIQPGDFGTVRYAMDILTSRGMCADDTVRGVPKQAVWPYPDPKAPDPDQFLHVRPAETCFEFAAKHRMPEGKYYLSGELDHLRGCLAEGHPLTILIQQCSWGRVGRDGSIPLPTKIERANGSAWHAMVLVGYDDAKRHFIVRNSMGTTWGKRGYGTISYDFVVDEDICDPASFWTLRLK